MYTHTAASVMLAFSTPFAAWILCLVACSCLAAGHPLMGLCLMPKCLATLNSCSRNHHACSSLGCTFVPGALPPPTVAFSPRCALGSLCIFAFCASSLLHLPHCVSLPLCLVLAPYAVFLHLRSVGGHSRSAYLHYRTLLQQVLYGLQHKPALVLDVRETAGLTLKRAVATHAPCLFALLYLATIFARTLKLCMPAAWRRAPHLSLLSQPLYT